MNGPATAEPNGGAPDPHLSDEEDEETQKLKMRPPDIDQVSLGKSLASCHSLSPLTIKTWLSLSHVGVTAADRQSLLGQYR
jgi:hypothetical protein